VRSLVRVGDLVSFARQPMDLSDDLYAGHSMDDRSCVAAVTTCLQLLKRHAPPGMFGRLPACRKK
jgi:putative aminopeptidase FrvX